jgi:hypothetical protein
LDGRCQENRTNLTDMTADALNGHVEPCTMIGKNRSAKVYR